MLWRGLSPEDAVQIVLCRHDPSLPHPGSRRSPACHRPDALQLLCGLVSGLEDLMSRRDAFANERNQHRASHMSELRTEWAAQSRDARFLPASQLV